MHTIAAIRCARRARFTARNGTANERVLEWQVQSRRRSRDEDQRTVSAMFALRKWRAARFRTLMSVGIKPRLRLDLQLC